MSRAFEMVDGLLFRRRTKLVCTGALFFFTASAERGVAPTYQRGDTISLRFAHSAPIIHGTHRLLRSEEPVQPDPTVNTIAGGRSREMWRLWSDGQAAIV